MPLTHQLLSIVLKGQFNIWLNDGMNTMDCSFKEKLGSSRILFCTLPLCGDQLLSLNFFSEHTQHSFFLHFPEVLWASSKDRGMKYCRQKQVGERKQNSNGNRNLFSQFMTMVASIMTTPV